MNQKIVDELQHYGNGNTTIVAVDELTKFSTVCGTVGNSQITPEFRDWLKSLGVFEAHVMVGDDGLVQAMGIDYELTPEDEDNLYDEESFFQQFSQGYSLRPDPYDGMTLFESE